MGAFAAPGDLLVKQSQRRTALLGRRERLKHAVFSTGLLRARERLRLTETSIADEQFREQRLAATSVKRVVDSGRGIGSRELLRRMSFAQGCSIVHDGCRKRLAELQCKREAERGRLAVLEGKRLNCERRLDLLGRRRAAVRQARELLADADELSDIEGLVVSSSGNMLFG